jgi:hypothetical protein
MFSIQPDKGQRPLTRHWRVHPKGSCPLVIAHYPRTSIQARLELRPADGPMEATDEFIGLLADALIDGGADD